MQRTRSIIKPWDRPDDGKLEGSAVGMERRGAGLPAFAVGAGVDGGRGIQALVLAVMRENAYIRNKKLRNERDPPVIEHLLTTLMQENLMPIRVFIKRHIKEGREEEAIAMLSQFRRMAQKQPGYILGETLINHFDSRSITIVSSWQKIEDWMHWQNRAERAANEAMIESLLEQPTKYEIYDASSIRGRLSSRGPGHEFDEVS